MDYRKITIEDLSELAKIYAETFNSDPWYDKWTQKTAEKRLAQMINNGGFFGIGVRDQQVFTAHRFGGGDGESAAHIAGADKSDFHTIFHIITSYVRCR